MAYLYDLTDTWNAAGTVFNAIKMNVTNTASAAGSKIVSLQVGATDRFTVDKDGNGYFSGTLQAVGSISSPNLYIGANSGTIGMQDNTASILAYNATGSGGITNTLRFITGAAERVRIDGSGNVGIGTSSPTALLHLSASAPRPIVQGTANGNYATWRYIAKTSGGAAVGFEQGLGITADNAFELYDSQGSQSVSRYFAGASGYWQWLTNGSERMRLDASGNVGIGTTALSNKFTVLYTDASAWAPNSTIATEMLFNNGALNNASATTLYQVVYGDSTTGGVKVGAVASGSYSADFVVANRNGGTFQENLRLTASGNVGIGTSSPGAKLHVDTGAATGTSLIVGAAAASSSQINMGIGVVTAGRPFIGTNTNTNPLEIGTRNASALILLTDTTERMRIDSSGNLGIGTSSPLAPLHVYRASSSSVRIDTDASASTTQLNFAIAGVNKWSLYRPGSSNDLRLFDNVNTADVMTWQAGGNVGIGTSSPSVALQVQRSSANATIRIASSGGAGRDWDIKSQTDGYLTIGSDLLASQLNLYAGNLGLGGTPSAWLSAYRALDIGTDTSLVSQGGSTAYYFNSYRDSNGNFIYKTSAAASRYQQGDGAHYWHTAPSGTAGNAISFTQAMTLDASGNLAVGSGLAATARLIVASTTSTGEMRIQGSGTNSFYGGLYKDNGTGEFRITQADGGVGMTFYTGSSPSERMRIDSSGNLLVGTATPAYSTSGRGLVEVNGSSSAIIAIKTGDTARGYFGASTTLTELSAVGASQPLAFTTNGAERARIDSSGNVGIGTSSPGLPLDVQSNASGLGIRIRGRAADSNGYLQFSSNNLASSSYIGSDGASLRFDTGGTERARIDSSGNLLVGTTALAPDSGFSFLSSGYTAECRMRVGHTTGTASGSAYAEFLYAAGTIGSITQNGTTAVAYNTSSDYRLKDIDGPIQNSGAYIDALKPVQGSWKADGSRFIGLIAHEVQEVSETQIATGVKDGDEMQAMDYSAPELIANLIAEIQSLRARVAQLEGN